MEVRAILRNLRTSPRKVRPVIRLIKGLQVDAAVAQLTFMKVKPAKPVLKLLNSAIANAENNFKLDRSTLMVKTTMADGGPTVKRFTPRAMGRATPIRKRTAHITIVLAPMAAETSTAASAEKKPAKKAASKAPKAAASKTSA